MLIRFEPATDELLASLSAEGVGELWCIDPATQTVRRYARNPRAKVFGDPMEVQAGQRFESAILRGRVVALDEPSTGAETPSASTEG